LSVRPAGPGFPPLDEALGLVPGSLSPHLLEGVVRLGQSMPFAQAAEELAFFWGVFVGEDTIRRQTEGAGAALVAVEDAAVGRLERDWPAPPQGPAVAQWSMDGAMVSLLHREWAEVKTAVVGRVEQRRGKAGLVEAHATDLVYCSRLAEVGDFTQAQRLLVHRTGLHTAGLVAAVSDGAPWIQGVVDTYRRDAVRILDFPHALEHVALAGGAAFGPGTPAGLAWLAEQAHTLKHETPEVVLAALRALPVADAADRARAALLRDETLAYLEARLPQLQYAAFQARGLPIGSGAVESANKLVVEARLKGSGMHWERANVTPMVALRACRGSGRWAQDWPAILRQLRRAEEERREARRLQRHPPPQRPDPPNLRLLRSARRKLSAQRRQPAPTKRAG
jgi:hypothetical protein